MFSLSRTAAPLLTRATTLRALSTSAALRAPPPPPPPPPPQPTTITSATPPSHLPNASSPISTILEQDPTPIPPPPPPPAPEPVPAEPTPVARVRRPVGAFRGGLIGFLTGASLVGAYGYLQLLDDYGQASSLLLLSVEELKVSTEKMASHFQRLERLEANLDSIVKVAATKKDVEGLRTEYRKLLEAEHLDALDTKAHVWGLEQDLHTLHRSAATSVRI